MHSPDLTNQNIERIRDLFPGCVTETHDESGVLKLAVDFDQLRQELSDHIVDGPQERYHLNWPGKREALITANAPIAKTLRPCRKESVDFDTTKNLFIEGDNLEALKLLQETYLGKIKMIYIDPPYNTGKDFIYTDNFSESKDYFLQRSQQKDELGNRLVTNTDSNGRFHSNWLSMMYPRIKIAKSLLKDDGIIFISIDDSEVDSLKKLCNEIFGEDNFLAQIVWQKIHSIKNDAKYFSDTHEYILCYGKDISSCQINLLPRTEKMNARFKNPDNDPRGPWASGDLVAAEERKDGYFDIVGPTGKVYNVPKGKHWVYSQENLTKMVEDGRIWFGVNGDAFPRLKRYLSEVQQGRKADTLWRSSEVGHNQESKREIKSLFDGKAFFDTPKPVKLIKRCIELATAKDDIILDFFCGSATTAHAAFDFNSTDGGNRKFIMIQIPEPIDEKSEAHRGGFVNLSDLAKERIRRAGNKIIENENHKNWNRDIGFRVLKIDTSNMADVYYTPDKTKQADLLSQVENIKPGRNNSEDLLFQVMLDWAVDLTLPIRKEEIHDKTVFFVNTAPYDLIACFDDGVTEELVKELAGHEPLRVVFKDNGFAVSYTHLTLPTKA